MKFKKYLTIFLAAGMFTSCSDFLESSENDFRTLEEIKESFGQTKLLVTNIYSYLPADFCGIDGAMLDAATDDAVHVYKGSQIQRFVNGTWSANTPVDEKIAHYYSAIHDANFFLNEFNNLDFKEWEHSHDYEDWMKSYKNFEYEVRFLRAFYYFELVKRYQQVPLILDVLSVDEANSVKPNSTQEIFDFILKECTYAAEHLPLNYDGFKSREFGRVTKGIALAFKSRVTLYMASPLFNPSNDKAKWVAAAETAYDFISKASSMGYALDGKFENLFGDKNHLSKEIIWFRPMGELNDFEQKNFPMGVTNGHTSTCPSENLASSFEMADGRPFDWNKAEMRRNPYVGRDPRFYKTIVHEGMEWPKKKRVEIFEGGANGLPLLNATLTGYYLRKYVNNSVSFEPGAPATKPKHNWILIRYADILLSYAEAMVNAYGDINATTASCKMSALQAVNMVRTRVKMPAFKNSLTASDFMTKIKHERRVELAFEGHRFWDLRRWKQLGETANVYGVRIVKTSTGTEYTKVLVQNRPVDEKMYFYPIPNSEKFKNNNWIQNPGW